MVVDDGRWLAVKEERKRMEGNARPAGVDPLNAFPEVRSLHVVTVRIRSDLPKTLTPARPATRLHGRLYFLPKSTWGRQSLQVFPQHLERSLDLWESTITIIHRP